MLDLRKYVMAGAAMAALVGFCGTASATVVTATWDPAGSTPPLSNAGNFTFNQAGIGDEASIYLTPTGANTFSVTETGYLPIESFLLGSTPVFAAGLNGFGSPGLATAYGLYGEFTAISSLTCTSLGNCTGTFSSISLSLMGDPGDTTTFSFNSTTGEPVAANTSTDVTLATGHLTIGQNEVSLTDNVPGAGVTTTFDQNSSESGFFISPPSSVALNLFGTFTNNTTQVTCYAASSTSCAGDSYGGVLPTGAPAGAAVLFEIGKPTLGGGSINFTTVPEPASLALLGTSLFGFGIGIRRRRNRKAQA